MRLDLPPGGFLRLPEAELAAPDGSEGCGISSCSTSSGQSAEATETKKKKKKKGDAKEEACAPSNELRSEEAK